MERYSSSNGVYLGGSFFEENHTKGPFKGQTVHLHSKHQHIEMHLVETGAVVYQPRTPNNQLKMDVSYIKTWFIIQLKQPFLNGWPQGVQE